MYIIPGRSRSMAKPYRVTFKDIEVPKADENDDDDRFGKSVENLQAKYYDDEEKYYDELEKAEGKPYRDFEHFKNDWINEHFAITSDNQDDSWYISDNNTYFIEEILNKLNEYDNQPADFKRRSEFGSNEYKEILQRKLTPLRDQLYDETIEQEKNNLIHRHEEYDIRKIKRRINDIEKARHINDFDQDIKYLGQILYKHYYNKSFKI